MITETIIHRTESNAATIYVDQVNGNVVLRTVVGTSEAAGTMSPEAAEEVAALLIDRARQARIVSGNFKF